MPAIKFNGTPPEAINLYMLSADMRGGDSYFRARSRVRDKLKAAWPEVFDGPGVKTDDPVFLERREVEITPNEQTALAEGILEFCQRNGTGTEPPPSDARKEQALALATLLKMRPWVEKMLDKCKPLNDFDGSDEGFQPEGGEQNG